MCAHSLLISYRSSKVTKKTAAKPRSSLKGMKNVEASFVDDDALNDDVTIVGDNDEKGQVGEGFTKKEDLDDD